MSKVILVDKNDRALGVGEKLRVHRDGKLHRAFSVFVFNSKGEILLQKRAKSKYHSGGLWTNACCSHPLTRKNIRNEAKKRLKEEMGIECELEKIFSFVYKAKVRELTEYELDHVFCGKFDGNPKINLEEAEDWKWMNFKKLKEDVRKNPQKYTYWFRLILKNCGDEFFKQRRLQK